MFRHLSSEPPFGGSTIRILALDIETKPALCYVWTLHEPRIGLDQIVDPGGMFCYGSQWLGETKFTFKTTHHDGREGMIQTLHAALDEADAVLHYNGTSFDVKHVNREMMELGLNPPSPYKQIDLYKTVRSQARFLSNKFDHVLSQLGLAGKVPNGGFKLWLDCMDGDEKAWRRMKRYNRRDVTGLFDAYNRLQAWIPNHPSHAAELGAEACTRCASTNLQRRGTATTLTATYPRFQCQDCGGWMRGNKRETGTSVVAI